MSRKTGPVANKATSKTSFQVKPVYATEVAAIVLEELSHTYGDCCNYLEAAALVRGGHTFLALTSIEQQNVSRGVSSARECWVQAQALSVVKKLTDPDVDRWALTKAHWFRTEQRCKRLNYKFHLLRTTGRIPAQFVNNVAKLSEALLYALGEAPPVEEICEAAHYGPGSTVSIRGREVFYARKLEANECTPRAISLAARALCYDKAAWAHVGMDPVYSHLPEAREGFLRVMGERLAGSAVRHDRLMFIHKNITSLRSIGAQPTCSGMLQLGVHTVMVPILKRIGIDLTNQGWNQLLAREGSLHWEEPECYVTLDKSDASNLLVKMLVAFSLPQAWSELLLQLRTPGYEAPPEFGGGRFDYEMYAGMGNGTTFAVESLVFWAIAAATYDGSIEEFVAKREFAVYGDDVILRRSHAKRYMALAKYLGFKFNAKKTFLDGPFRESCGADYYAGVPVRPATLNSETDALTSESLIGFHNTLADNLTFPLTKACKRIRALYKARMYPLVPTDNQGNLGFRPMGEFAFYDVVKDSSGKVLVSSVWHRPRVYQLDVKPQMARLGELDSWTQIAVSLLRARQSVSNGQWSLPVRKLTHVNVRPESDLDRKDLAIMLKNQLAKLAVRKDSPWWNNYRGG